MVVIQALKKEIKRNGSLYLLVAPVVVYYLVFAYVPIFNNVIAFKHYLPARGIWGSDWAGFKYFNDFFTSPYFGRVLWNTVKLSTVSIIFAFPAPILLALLVNELKSRRYSRVVQTASYLPHFISIVVVCSMIKEFVANDGIITIVLGFFGFPNVNMLNEPELFVPIYIISDIWQGIGWGSIIYLAALTGISPELYESAKIDGANKWVQLIRITIPSIIPTIIIMLILRIGSFMNVGFEKIILLQNPLIYETSDIIASYVYREGILSRSYSFASAVGLFNSVVNCTLIVGANYIGRRYNGTSIF